MNLGDPIQSLAVLRILRNMGISEKDIFPVDRYDLADYDGERVVLIFNGPEGYEHYAYHTRSLPISDKIVPVFIGVHFRRELSESELVSLREHQPIGCRDEYTVHYLKNKGVDAFLSGCLTLTFPRRKDTEEQRRVFLVDCPESLLPYIPKDLKDDAEALSQVIRVRSESKGNRLTDEETDDYIRKAEQQLERLRDEAALVITSRLHVATPCAAMGIPTILARDVFDERYGFIDQYLPLYTPDRYHEINWHPEDMIPERAKEELISVCKNLIDLAIGRELLRDRYANRRKKLFIQTEEAAAVGKLPMALDKVFSYAIWGVCMPNSYLLHEAMQERYPNARIVCAIDTYASGEYLNGLPIIQPREIGEKLAKDTVILVVAPAAHEAAHCLLKGEMSYVLIKGANIVLAEV